MESKKELQEILNYQFKNTSLLKEALTHSTFAYEAKENIKSNQRLEFLGDSILGMVTAEYLFKNYPDSNEGELTQRRACLVNKDFLAKKAREFNLGRYILLGRGEEKCGGRDNSTNLSGLLEAIIAAVYLDGGFLEAKKFVLNIIGAQE